MFIKDSFLMKSARKAVSSLMKKKSDLGFFAGWVDPNGKFYRFKSYHDSHLNWILNNKDLLKEEYGIETPPNDLDEHSLKDILLEQGWIRIRDNEFEAQSNSPEIISRIKNIIKSHENELPSNVFLNLAGNPGLVSKKDLLEGKVASLIKKAWKGWLAPDGKYFPVENTHHVSWPHQPENKKILVDQYGFAPDYGNLDTMLENGWVRISSGGFHIGVLNDDTARLIENFLIENPGKYPKGFVLDIEPGEHGGTVPMSQERVIENGFWAEYKSRARSETVFQSASLKKQAIVVDAGWIDANGKFRPLGDADDHMAYVQMLEKNKDSKEALDSAYSRGWVRVNDAGGISMNYNETAIAHANDYVQKLPPEAKWIMIDLNDLKASFEIPYEKVIENGLKEEIDFYLKHKTSSLKKMAGGLIPPDGKGLFPSIDHNISDGLRKEIKNNYGLDLPKEPEHAKEFLVENGWVITSLNGVEVKKITPENMDSIVRLVMSVGGSAWLNETSTDMFFQVRVSGLGETGYQDIINAYNKEIERREGWPEEYPEKQTTLSAPESAVLPTVPEGKASLNKKAMIEWGHPAVLPVKFEDMATIGKIEDVKKNVVIQAYGFLFKGEVQFVVTVYPLNPILLKEMTEESEQKYIDTLNSLINYSVPKDLKVIMQETGIDIFEYGDFAERDGKYYPVYYPEAVYSHDNPRTLQLNRLLIDIADVEGIPSFMREISLETRKLPVLAKLNKKASLEKEAELVRVNKKPKSFLNPASNVLLLDWEEQFVYDMAIKQGLVNSVIDYWNKPVETTVFIPQAGEQQVLNSLKPKASVLDYPHPGLDPDVWDQNNNLLPQHKDKILNKLYSFFRNPEKAWKSNPMDWITDIFILGSLTSYQYNSRTDIDVHVHVSLKDLNGKEFGGQLTSEQLVEKMDAVRKTLNDVEKDFLPGTSHPIEFFFESFESPAIGGERVYLTKAMTPEGLYDLNADKWIQPPRTVDMDYDPEEIMPPELMQEILNLIRSLDIKIGEIERNIQNVDQLAEVIKVWPQEQQKRFQVKIDDRIRQIDLSLQEYVATIQNVIDNRHKEYKPLSDANLTFKALQRFNYIGLKYRIEQMQKETPVLTPEMVDKVKEVLEPPKESEHEKKQGGGGSTNGLNVGVSRETPASVRGAIELVASLKISAYRYWMNPQGQLIEMKEQSHMEWFMEHFKKPIKTALQEGWIQISDYYVAVIGLFDVNVADLLKALQIASFGVDTVVLYDYNANAAYRLPADKLGKSQEESEQVLLDLKTNPAKYKRALNEKGLSKVALKPAFYLTDSHAQMVWNGEKKKIVKARMFKRFIGEERYLASRERVYGIITLEEPEKITIDEFDKHFEEHQVTEEERLRWWPEVTEFYLYPFNFEPFKIPRGWEPIRKVRKKRVDPTQTKEIGTPVTEDKEPESRKGSMAMIKKHAGSIKAWIAPDGEIFELEDHEEWMKYSLKMLREEYGIKAPKDKDMQSIWKEMYEKGWIRSSVDGFSMQVFDDKVADFIQNHFDEFNFTAGDIMIIDTWASGWKSVELKVKDIMDEGAMEAYQSALRRSKIQGGQMSKEKPESISSSAWDNEEGWLAPDDKFYPLGYVPTHYGWVADYKDFLQKQYQIPFTGEEEVSAYFNNLLYDRGWIRVASEGFSTNNPDSIKRLEDFIIEHQNKLHYYFYLDIPGLSDRVVKKDVLDKGLESLTRSISVSVGAVQSSNRNIVKHAKDWLFPDGSLYPVAPGKEHVDWIWENRSLVMEKFGIEPEPLPFLGYELMEIMEDNGAVRLTQGGFGVNNMEQLDFVDKSFFQKHPNYFNDDFWVRVKDAGEGFIPKQEAMDNGLVEAFKSNIMSRRLIDKSVSSFRNITQTPMGLEPTGAKNCRASVTAKDPRGQGESVDIREGMEGGDNSLGIALGSLGSLDLSVLDPNSVYSLSYVLSLIKGDSRVSQALLRVSYSPDETTSLTNAPVSNDRRYLKGWDVIRVKQELDPEFKPFVPVVLPDYSVPLNPDWILNTSADSTVTFNLNDLKHFAGKVDLGHRERVMNGIGKQAILESEYDEKVRSLKQQIDRAYEAGDHNKVSILNSELLEFKERWGYGMLTEKEDSRPRKQDASNGNVLRAGEGDLGRGGMGDLEHTEQNVTLRTKGSNLVSEASQAQNSQKLFAVKKSSYLPLNVKDIKVKKLADFTPSFFSKAPEGFDWDIIQDNEHTVPETWNWPYAKRPKQILPLVKEDIVEKDKKKPPEPSSMEEQHVLAGRPPEFDKQTLLRWRKTKVWPHTTWNIESPDPSYENVRIHTDPGLNMSDGTGDYLDQDVKYDSTQQYTRPNRNLTTPGMF